MTSRHTLLQDLRAAFGETAARLAALLAPANARRAEAPAPAPASRVIRPVVLARRFAFLLAVAAAGSPAADAGATVRPRAHVPVDFWVDGNLVDVQIRVAGEAAPLYLSPRGDRRHYFEAFAGRNYAIVLRNNSPRRIGVLLAVDGLNVVSGEMTTQSPAEPMYVLGPWESATIRGWRTSMDDVRRFVFVDEKRSYASRTGQANSDMGWIRVLAFREQQRAAIHRWKDGRWRDQEPRGPLPWFDAPGERSHSERDDAPESAPRAEAPRANEAPAPTMQRMDEGALEKSMASRESAKDAGGSFPGTGWGERRTDRVHYVDFTPERGATDLLVFRYEYARGLVALGIYPDRDRLRERDGGGMVGFARPPRW